jgi:YD repeat-containing protein
MPPGHKRRDDRRHHDTAAPPTPPAPTRTPPVGQGNRLTQFTQTGPAGTRTDTYGYDATGNTTAVQTADGTQSFEWDTEGELAGMFLVTGVLDASRMLLKFC